MVVDTVTQDDHLDDLIEEEEPEDLYDEYDGFDDEDDFEFQEKIIIPSPKVSITEENDIPIIVNNTASFEERILAASPEAQVYQELVQCDTCGRKFNPTALARHTKVCEKVKSKPKKIFDAVNKLWKKESDIEKPAPAPKTPKVKRRPLKPEDTYKTCDFCGRKFCENAFDRHVEFCKEKNNRITSSPVRDVAAQAKLIARTKYNPKEESKKSGRKSSSSPTRKESLMSLVSEYSLPQWGGSGRNTPSYSSLSRNDSGNLRSSKRSTSSGSSLLNCTKSLGRAQGLQYLRQGDARRNDGTLEDWDPEQDAKATTMSRDNSGRGSIRRPALTKAALLRLNAGEKTAADTEKKRVNNEFGSANNRNANNMKNNFDYMRARSTTPSSNLMTRSAYGDYGGFSRNEQGATGSFRKAATPQMPRRSMSRTGLGRESASPGPYSWQSFKPLSNFNAMTSARAEPDGHENYDNIKRKDSDNSLEGEYDHSKEYDPFQTAERQMQELLFGTSAPQKSSTSAASGLSNTSSAVKKPQAVRPVIGSAFTAYVPGKAGSGANTRGSPAKQYTGLDNLRSRTSYLTSLGAGEERSPGSHGQGHSAQSKFGSLGLSRDYSRHGGGSRRDSYDEFTPSPASSKLGSSSGSGLARSSSLRAPSTSNWKDLFPSLTRTPSNLQRNNLDHPNNSISNSSNSEDNSSNSSLARFCHECGTPFQGTHVRFCSACGVKRLYLF